jgi:hypothetical protein
MASKAAQRRARALRRWTALSVFGAVVAGAGMWSLLFLPDYLDYYIGHGPGGEISIIAPWVRRALFLFACGSLVLSFALSAVAAVVGARTAHLQTRRLGSVDQRAGVHFGSPLVFTCATGVLPGACLIVFPLVLLLNMFAGMFSPSFAVLDRATAPDGQEFAFLYFGVMQGQQMVLAQPVGSNAFRSVYRVLGENNGDWPRSWASVIRPAGPPTQTNRHLHFGPDGLVLVIVPPNQCFLAYDARSREFWGHGPIEGLSPFVLLGENTSVHEDDVISTRGHLQTAHPDAVGVPRRSTLVAGTRHANPIVRALAAEWLAVCDERAKAPRPDTYDLHE